MESRYFNEFYDSKNGEWRLVHDIILDAIYSFGVDMFYIPKNITTRDDIFGQDIGKNILDKSFEMRMALLTYENFSSAGTLFGKFGINITDKSKFVIAQDTYEKITGYDNAMQRIGDVIYIPLLKKCGKSLWEVRSIDPFDENKLMQFGDKHIYVFGCNVLKLDTTDKFDTPVAEINDINDFINNVDTLESNEVKRRIENMQIDDKDPFNSDR